MTATLTQIGELQLATFHVGEMLLAIPIALVQEINRNLTVTRIPHAPRHVRGVINLRGDVATLIDLRRVLGLEDHAAGSASTVLIVRNDDEAVGLLVDRVADIISIDTGSLVDPPANVGHVEQKYFQGIYRSDRELVVTLNLEEVLSMQVA